MKVLLTSFGIFLIFFGLHTAIALAPGKTLLAPFVLCFIGAVGVSFVNAKRTKSRFVGLFVILIVVLAALAVITALQDGDWEQHIISTMLLLYSLFIAYGTFLGLQVMGIRRASRFFLLAAFILIGGSFLELYGGLQPASDAFRQTVNSWRPQVVYNNNIRDIENYGGIRPKFFASEPAVLGDMTGYAILFWFLSARRYTARRLFEAALLAGPAFLLIRTPTILVSFLVCSAFFVSELGRKRGASRMREAFLGISILTVMVLAPPFISENSHYGQSASFFERELGPPLIAGAVLQAQPLFGTGVGGWEQLIPFGQSVFSKAGGAVEQDLLNVSLGKENGGRMLVDSQVWEFWIDLGLVGGILVLWILWRGIKQLEVPHRFMVFACSSLVLSLSGGLVNPTGWVGLFSMACLYKMHSSALLDEEEAVVSEPQPIEMVAGYPQLTS